MLRIYDAEGTLLRWQSWLGEWYNINRYPSGNESYMTWMEGDKIPYNEEAFNALVRRVHIP